MKQYDRNPEDPTSKIQDMSTHDDVELMDSNRVVIKTNRETSGKQEYIMKVNIEHDGKSETEVLRSDTKKGLFRKFTSWYAGEMDDEDILDVL